MSAAEEIKTTMVFNGKQQHDGKYRIQVKGEFMTEGIQAALGPKFAESLLALENVSGQTAKQKKAVRNNITGMGLLIMTNKSGDILVMIECTVSEN